MKYISLNHNSAPTSFRNAVINGLAPDKGLYFPEKEICLSNKLLESLNKIEDIELCYEVIKDFVGDEIPKNILIDEAVRLSKKFGADNAYKFVNATLDTLLK